MQSGPQLSVSIHDVEFAKDYQYFITVQMHNEKKRTDVSAFARNPVFTSNTFLFPIVGQNTLSEIVTFTACVVLDDLPADQAKGTSKILGEGIIDLAPFGLQPNELYNAPVRQQMKFTRVKDGRQISVGRFIVSFKIVNQQLAQSFVENADLKRLNSGQIFQQLPQLEATLDFPWRIRIDVRCASNLPSQIDMNPQAFVEVGWTQFKNTSPQQQRILKTPISNSINPVWNSVFMVGCPEGITQRKGFVAVYLKDRNTLEDIVQCFIPVDSMNPFTPYNLTISKKEVGQCRLMISSMLECRTKPNERIFDLIVSDVLLEPLPKQLNKMALILTIGDNEPKLQFYNVDEKEDSIQRVLEFDDAKEFCYQMSQVMSMPPAKSSRAHRAAAVFTLPESILRQNVKLHLAIPDDSKFEKHQLPTVLAGSTVTLDEDLVKLLVEKTKKRVFVAVNYHKDLRNPLTIGKTKCQIELGTHQNRQQRLETGGLDQSQLSMNKNKSMARSLQLPAEGELNNNSARLQNGNNNEILNRVLKQLDDRSQSLKIAASEIVDLRKQVKLLQSENNILRRQASQQDDSIRDLVSQELETMGVSELKQKIMKVASLYKNERVCVKQLEKTLKTLEPQVAQTMQLNSTVATMGNHIKSLTDKVAQYKKEAQRASAYKETIKKQQKVIEKLERVATQSLKDVRRARQDRLELEQLRSKGSQPQLIQPPSRGRTDQSQQILRLQRIIANLQQNMKESRINTLGSDDNNTAELQFKLHKSEARVSSLEEELTKNAREYAKDVAKYKLLLAQKQALLDGFTLSV